ncbi:hypothetical protein G4B88_001814 [Cannabis sativa]|uniref:Uncharacterized protein n=1 Tax=Cannabis sativa TaxID=3483 RepID=A0A7J6I4N5_CANSA|nr:hypothetical protein G4B88_001814 [Cannabis sativa]
MAHLLLLCLIFSNAYLGLAQSQQKIQTIVWSSSKPLSNNSPAPSPYKAKTDTIRKLGKHQPEVTMSSSEPTPSPSKGKNAAEPLKETGHHDKAPLGQFVEHHEGIQVENVHLSKHHHSINKSVAGGGVILGGLATTFLVAVFCYIRATGRHKNDTVSSVPGSPPAAAAAASATPPV